MCGYTWVIGLLIKYDLPGIEDKSMIIWGY